MRPFGIRVAGCWLASKFLLEAVSEALSLNGCGSATGIDAGATLGLAMVDLSGLRPDLACNEQVVLVTASAVIASCELHFSLQTEGCFSKSAMKETLSSAKNMYIHMF